MTTETNSDGYYVFNSVDKGIYAVTVEPGKDYTRFVSKTVIKEDDSSAIDNVNFSAKTATKRQTSSGEVIGYVDENGSHVWKGIPYAKAPIKNLRWKAPRPAKEWEGVYMALEIGPLCTQHASKYSNLPIEEYGNTTGSEDCLFLNIWSPEYTQDSIPDGDDKLPVMIWIHGGSNITGHSGSYTGMELAKKYNNIVVAINYRLGPFGWFIHPMLREEGITEEDKSGNYGTLDIIRALIWVRDNIYNFGGNPDNVTIFGESAGAANIITLLTSPLAGGLFHRAIMQSGTILGTSIEDGENYLDDEIPGHNYSSREIINQLLIADNLASNRENAKNAQRQMNNNAIADYLYSKSNYEILSCYRFGVGLSTLAMAFRDGTVIPALDALTLIKNKNYNCVPIIIGSNRDEDKLFRIFDKEHVETGYDLFPVNEYKYLLDQFPIRVKDKKYYELTTRYRSNYIKAEGVDKIAKLLCESQGPNVYAYRFDWDEEPKILGVDLAFMLGAAHGLEIEFVFGTPDEFVIPWMIPFLYTKKNYPGRAAIAGSMSSYWAEFARTGSPGYGYADSENIEWQPWNNQEGENKMIIFDTPEDKGISMSPITVSTEGLKAELQQEDDFSTKDQHCKVYVDLFGYDEFYSEKCE